MKVNGKVGNRIRFDKTIDACVYEIIYFGVYFSIYTNPLFLEHPFVVNEVGSCLLTWRWNKSREAIIGRAL